LRALANLWVGGGALPVPPAVAGALALDKKRLAAVADIDRYRRPRLSKYAV
jgi:hypothetical protein